MTLTARTAAALLAVITWAGLAVQFHAAFALQGSVGSTLTVLLWYFTITTNLLVAVVFTGIALGRDRFARPSLVGATTLYILLVGVIYGLLLHGLAFVLRHVAALGEHTAVVLGALGYSPSEIAALGPGRSETPR